MTATISPPVHFVTQPCRVDDMPEDTYHNDPVPGGSLSSTGARRLLPPHCPAQYRYNLDHPGDHEQTPAMIFGTAVHRTVLQSGAGVIQVDAPDWRTKHARTLRDEITAVGGVALLSKDWDIVQEMAEQVHAHPVAGPYLASPGRAEVSLFDQIEVAPELGALPVPVWRRARVDFLPDAPDRADGLIVGEYKTVRSADIEALMRQFTDLWYPMQAAWYLDLIESLGIAARPRMLFICQEKDPPYLVSVVTPDDIALQIARIRNADAIRTYAKCVSTGVWPDHTGGDVAEIPLTPWVEKRYTDVI